MLEPCKCMCHTNGYTTVKACNPPIPCCLCESPARPSHKISKSTLELKQQISDIYNEMGTLSMRINENYSKMREFEKQIVQSMRDQIHVLEKRVERSVTNCHCNDGLTERIEKLEKEIQSTHKYTSDCDKQRFDSDEVLRQRIEALEDGEKDKMEAIENLNFCSTSLSELKERIEKLELRMNNQENYYPHQLIERDDIRSDLGKTMDGIVKDSLECDHEWDCSQIYASIPPKFKCKLCGKFSENKAWKVTMPELGEPIPCGSKPSEKTKGLSFVEASEQLNRGKNCDTCGQKIMTPNYCDYCANV